MSIQLTPQQQKLLDTEKNGPARVIDPRTDTAYILVPETVYASVLEILEDERRQQTIHAVALRNAAARIDEVP